MANPVATGASPDTAKVICVVVHGRGQTQKDMIDSIVDRVTLPDVRYVLPKSDDVGWYGARAIDPLTDVTLAEMAKGIRQVAALITAERRVAPALPLLLCGFSQGACLSVELLMDQPQLADAACLLTGCRIGAGTDVLGLKPLDGMAIYASCGDADPWIPASAHYRMLGDLTQAGGRLRSDMFPGRPHAVAATEIAVLSDMLQALAVRQNVWGETG